MKTLSKQTKQNALYLSAIACLMVAASCIPTRLPCQTVI